MTTTATLWLNPELFDDPMVRTLSPEAFRAHVLALCHLTRFPQWEGLVVSLFSGAVAPEVITELVLAGLWVPDPDGIGHYVQPPEPALEQEAS